MKSLIFSMVLISLCSCGEKTSKEVSGVKESEVQVEQNRLNEVETEMSPFALPQINSYRYVTIDKEISSLYENMTILNNKDEKILGDRPFYVMIGENYNNLSEMSLGFYARTVINSIYYIDSKNNSLPFKEIKKSNLPALKIIDITYKFKEELVWGTRDIDNTEKDMLNKAYVIKIEESETVNSLDYKSESTYLVWFECMGGIKHTTEFTYSCSKKSLRFHYKLLDYSLTSK